MASVSDARLALDAALLRLLGTAHSLYWLADKVHASRGDVDEALGRLQAAGRIAKLNHADAASPLSVWLRAETVAGARAGTRAA